MTPSSSGTKYLVEICGFRKSLTNDHLSCYIDHRLPEQPYCHGISVFLCAHSQERLRTVEENIKILSHSKHKPSGLGTKREVIELVFILAKMFSNNNHLHSEKKKKKLPFNVHLVYSQVNSVKAGVMHRFLDPLPCILDI